MKYSVAAVSAFAAVALAKPSITNLSFDVEVGKPFTLTFAGCASGCDIELQTGASKDLKDVKTLATGVTGTSTTVTLDKIPSGTYNFKITDSTGDSNYSAQFPVQGDVAASASASASSASSETSAKETNTATAAPTSTAASSSAEKSTTLVKSTTAHSTVASNSTTAAPTSHSATAKHNSTSSALTTGAPTTTGTAAGRLASPIALVAGVALALAFLS
ncbi:hypothetical protein TRIATDRAFT_170067, partial [Trichoderma atroviride IMI 206040]